MPPPFDLSLLDQMTTLYEFDDIVTGPLHGFRDADDYYTQSSSRQFLGSINTPTHILHAIDDPFMTETAIPTANELSESVTLELLNAGGHVGFVNSVRPRWLESRVAEVLSAAVFDHTSCSDPVDTTQAI